MVMYDDDGKGNLYLRYEYTPSASEVVRDVLDAPIENGETYQSKRRGQVAITDNRVLVDATLGKKAEEEIVSTISEEKPHWKAIRKEGTSLFGFEFPEDGANEQEQLMKV